jgi:hypothetical protein
VKARSVTALLTPTTGWERSNEAVAATMRRLGFGDEDDLDPDQVTKVLEDLALEDGIVGVTARVLLTKSTKGSAPRAEATSLPTIPPPSSPSEDAPASVRLAATIGVHEVIGQIAPLLGADWAEAAVQASQRKLALPRERLDHEQAVRLLDDLGHQDGLVGMTARFVRARVLARFAT